MNPTPRLSHPECLPGHAPSGQPLPSFVPCLAEARQIPTFDYIATLEAPLTPRPLSFSPASSQITLHLHSFTINSQPSQSASDSRHSADQGYPVSPSQGLTGFAAVPWGGSTGNPLQLLTERSAPVHGLKAGFSTSSSSCAQGPGLPEVGDGSGGGGWHSLMFGVLMWENLPGARERVSSSSSSSSSARHLAGGSASSPVQAASSPVQAAVLGSDDGVVMQWPAWVGQDAQQPSLVGTCFACLCRPPWHWYSRRCGCRLLTDGSMHTHVCKR